MADADKPCCRICLGDADNGAEGRLFRPCRCRGTVSHVHVNCLDKWRRAAADRKHFYQCDLCKYKYQFGYSTLSPDRLLLARLMGNRAVRFVLAVVVLVLTVFFAGVGWHTFCSDVPWRMVIRLTDPEWWMSGSAVVGIAALFGSVIHLLGHLLYGFDGIPAGYTGGWSSWGGGGGGGGGGGKSDGGGILLAILVVLGLLIALWYIYGFLSTYGDMAMDRAQRIILEYCPPEEKPARERRPSQSSMRG
eukprot:TRINITY_DN1199_c4_g1_i1.p2 TRINITY_DN1199_c4_g1~~TRINITY_DN1199_c4_g1_i1.p2  ORF type:complete len:275 (+),score=67.23 TRINITY_DN1199_c4_g1_i1:83-826(+)